MPWTHYYNPSTQTYDPLDKGRGQDGQVLSDAVKDWSGSDFGGWKIIHPADTWLGDHYNAEGYIGNGIPKTGFDWQNNDQNDKFDWYVLNVQPPTDGAEDQTFSINVHWNLGVKTGYMDTPLDLVLYEVDLVNNTFQNIEQLDSDRIQVLTLPTPGVAEMKVSADNLEPGEYLVQLADPGWADGGTKEFNYSVDYNLDVWLSPSNEKTASTPENEQDNVELTLDPVAAPPSARPPSTEDSLPEPGSGPEPVDVALKDLPPPPPVPAPPSAPPPSAEESAPEPRDTVQDLGGEKPSGDDTSEEEKFAFDDLPPPPGVPPPPPPSFSPDEIQDLKGDEPTSPELAEDRAPEPPASETVQDLGGNEPTAPDDILLG